MKTLTVVGLVAVGAAVVAVVLNNRWRQVKAWAGVYAKFIAALSAALGVAVSVTVDGHVSLNDAMAIAAAGVGALVVAAVPNKTP